MHDEGAVVVPVPLQPFVVLQVAGVLGGHPAIGTERPLELSGSQHTRQLEQLRLAAPGAETRVRARTFAYESSPRENAAHTSGNPGSARATRTCSRAERGVNAHRHESHSAHEP